MMAGWGQPHEEHWNHAVCNDIQHLNHKNFGIAKGKDDCSIWRYNRGFLA
jgi:hypothetical protein